MAYQRDQRGPLERLYGFEKIQAERQALQRKQAMEQQRDQILREAYQPGEEARTEYDFQQPEAPQPGGMSNIMGALGIADAPQMQTKQIEAKPEQFNRDTAINRMYSIGDFEGAKELVDNEYKGAMAGRSSGGANAAYGSEYVPSDKEGFMHPAQYMRGGGLTVDRSVYIPEKLTYRDLGGADVAYGAGGQVRHMATKTANPYQQFQMDPTRQAEVAGAEAEAGARGKAAGERGSEAIDKNVDIDNQVEMIDRLASMAAGGFYGSKLSDQARLGAANKTGVGADAKEYINTKNMSLIARRLLLSAKPKGSGNPTEGEWKMYGETIADPSAYPDSQTYLQALQNYKEVLTGQRPMPDQYRQKQSTPAPVRAPVAQAGAPKQGAIKNGYIFMGGNPADPKSWRKL